MADNREQLVERLAALGVSDREWIGMDEMSADALELLLESVEQHQELWVMAEDEHNHDHHHDHAPGEPHQAPPGPAAEHGH